MILVSDLISDCQQHTSTIGQRISEADWILYSNKANKYFTTGYKMPTTERETDLLLFSGVYEYPLPSDYAGIMPPRKPYGNVSPDFVHQSARSVSRYITDRNTAIKFDRETPFLVVQYPDGSSQQIHDCESLTDNGTWTVSGDGSALALDTQISTQGSNSFRFTVTGSGGTTTLVNSTISSTIDLTDYLTNGWVFLDLQCPSGNTTALTSVRLRVGSDSSNYYEITATTRYRGDTILGGWGLIGFNMADKTTTGTPDDDAIDYVQILITHGTSGINGTYRLDNIFLALPTYFQLPYYSSQNVKTTGGTYQNKVTATSDSLLVPVEFEEVLVYKTLEIAASEKLMDVAKANYWRGELLPKERALKAKYGSQESKPQMFWYRRANKF